MYNLYFIEVYILYKWCEIQIFNTSSLGHTQEGDVSAI